jgi:transketolase
MHMGYQRDPWDHSDIWHPWRENTRVFNEAFSHQPEYAELLRNTELLAYLIRSYTTCSMTCAALGHPGGSFSEAELLSVMYNYVLKFDAADPHWSQRDVFYLSKCHACPGLYTCLALFGYFPATDLPRYGAWDSHLESHPDSTTTPGIEISGGSLGQIPGVAVGRALGMRRHGPDEGGRMVYVLVGDGECAEGAVWEAFMAAGHYKLDNLVFIIDNNKVQAKGFVQQDMSIEPLIDKLAAFNLQPWDVANGHNVRELIDLFNTIHTQRRGKPQAVILNTVKGKKVDMCQYNPNWHTSAPRTTDMAQDWLTEMWHRDGRRLGVPEDFPKLLGDTISVVPPLHDNPDHVVEKQA